MPETSPCSGCEGTGSIQGYPSMEACDYCGGKGFSKSPSADDLRSRQEPHIYDYKHGDLRYIFSFLEFIEARGDHAYKEQIAQRRAQVGQLHNETPFPTQRVYARFIVEE